MIKPKYEYTGEVYSIVVPSGVRDIMREGDALSHCVGKSDRYWERIEQQEAYILFLRKTAEIDKPYYTLEVEPNGTIRQKRTYFDRQNDDLKDAEMFLKEWQKVVSERLTESCLLYTSRDPKRVHGALFYALEDARTKDGHLYLEAESLLKAAMQLLNERIPLPQMRVPMSQVEQELSAMIRQDEVVSNHGNVYLPKQFLQESETAQKAVELFLAKPTVVDITQPLERVKNSLGLNLSKRQSEGVEMVFRHNPVSYTHLP